jgi:UDP-2,4-diacetamido-2,4,6-trideoxy-beta-L-altropyranose hydrolase
MRVVFRTDASALIGSGHVMRCLALAERLQHRGARIEFLCRELPGHEFDEIERKGYGLTRLPSAGGTSWEKDAHDSLAACTSDPGAIDLLVIDHYGLDARWERAFRPRVRRIFVFDDLADRPHDCDVLLDQNLREHPQTRYAGLVPPGTRVFVGPQYALLRAEFERIAARSRDRGIAQLLVYLGGGESRQELVRIVAGLHGLGAAAPASVVVLGKANPDASAVRRAASGLPSVTLLDTTTRMADLMDGADLAIGTCGIAAWERCALGLPSLVVITADNQRDDARTLHVLGAARSLGNAGTVPATRWTAEIDALRRDPTALQRMSRAAAAVMANRHAAARELEAALVN